MWQRQVTVTVTADGALAIPVLKEQVTLALPAGEYTVAADLQRGGAPTGDRLSFRVAAASALPRGKGRLRTWGLSAGVCAFLAAQGYSCEPYVPRQRRTRKPGIVLVGDVPADPSCMEVWAALRHEVEAGGCAVILSATPFRTDNKPKSGDATNAGQPAPAEAPWSDILKARHFGDWLYHRECVGKRHSVFASLQSSGILDWHYWGEVVGHAWFALPSPACEVMAAGFAVGYSCPGGYDSGILIGRQSCAKGTILFNSLPVLEHLGRHPAADRLLLNLVAGARHPEFPAARSG